VLSVLVPPAPEPPLLRVPVVPIPEPLRVLVAPIPEPLRDPLLPVPEEEPDVELPLSLLPGMRFDARSLTVSTTRLMTLRAAGIDGRAAAAAAPAAAPAAAATAVRVLRVRAAFFPAARRVVDVRPFDELDGLDDFDDFEDFDDLDDLEDFDDLEDLEDFDDLLPPLRLPAERFADDEEPLFFELFDPPRDAERPFDERVFDDFLLELREPPFFEPFFEEPPREEPLFDAAMFCLLVNNRCGEP
jgi:hypothetical protein